MPDLRYAVRTLLRHRRFAALAIGTMALGIAATTLLFSVTYGVLMKPLAWPDSDRLILLKETRGGTPPRFNTFSNAAYLAWRERAETIESIGAWSQRTVTLTGEGDPERLRVTAASASLFRVLSAHPLIGALFTERDEDAANGNVVVLGEALWRSRFGAAPGVLGRTVHLDGGAYTVIGILSDRFAFPDRRSRAFVPFRVPLTTGNYLSMFNAIAKLRPAVTPAQASAEGTARGQFVPDTAMTTMAIFGGTGPVGITASLLKDALTSDVRQPLLVLLAAVFLLLAAAAGNVAGLQLARATSRRRELAIRAALGAGNARVVRELLAENLLLGLAGGIAGLALTWLVHGVALSLLPADFPRTEDLRIDPVVIGAALLISAATSIVFGLIPALQARRTDLVSALAEDGSAPVGAGGASRVGRVRFAIIGCQIAIACVLLIGASLLGRSFVALLTVDRGYDPSGVLIARVSMPDSLFKPERRYELVGRIIDRLSALPGVTDAAFTSELPLTAGGSTAAFPLRTSAGLVQVQASPRVVSARSFPALGLRVVAGRGFSDADTESTRPVAVVNRAFERRYLHGSALNALIPMGVGYEDPQTEAAIVGIVDDVRYLTPNDATQPEIYYSSRQLHGRLIVPVVTLLLRTDGDPSAFAAAMRSAVADADAALVAESVMTLEDRLLAGLARPRLYTALLAGFALFALAIAGVGLFGVLSYTVAQRSRELAVRAALGARPQDILGLVARQALTITGAGVVAGTAAAALLVRATATLLYGVTPYDPLTFAVVPGVLLAVAVLVCAVPAIRAARVNPLRALRGS